MMDMVVMRWRDAALGAITSLAMDTEQAHARLEVGQTVDAFTVDTIAHGTQRVPADGLVHLQFRRFAGCPVCNLHLRSFARSIDAIHAAGVRTIAFFHSPAESMRPYQGDLPFATVADPERRFYRAFRVEQATFAVAHPKVMLSAMRGLFTAPSNPFAGGGGQTGLPADFLLSPGGRLLAVHYGEHAADHWEVEELLRLASSHG